MTKRWSEASCATTDVVMPLMRGTELAARVEAMSPSTRILLMSAYAMSEVAATGRAFISKPFSMQGLNDKVRQILGQRSPFARPSRPA
jgi:FixJ family two-component response regulator